MKQFILGILCFSLLGCNGNHTESATKPTSLTNDSTNLSSNKPPQKTGPLIEAYASYLARLDTTDAANNGKAVEKFKSIFDKADAATNDSAYSLFHQYFRRLANGIEIKYRDYWPTDSLTPEQQGVLPSDKALIATLQANGFKFLSSEGVWYVVENRDSIQKWFSPLVSPSMRDYLEMVTQQDNEGYAEDGAIIIPIESLVDRAVWWERFANGHTGFIMMDDVMGKYQFYLTELMRGEDNTPAVDWDDQYITDYFLKGYRHLFAKYPESNTAKLLKPYFDALQQKDMTKARQILSQYKEQKITLW